MATLASQWDLELLKKKSRIIRQANGLVQFGTMQDGDQTNFLIEAERNLIEETIRQICNDNDIQAFWL